MQKSILHSFVVLLLEAVQAADRTFTLKNLCQEPVWFGFSGGSVSARNSTVANCVTDSDCYEGSHCTPASPTISFCFV